MSLLDCLTLSLSTLQNGFRSLPKIFVLFNLVFKKNMGGQISKKHKLDPFPNDVCNKNVFSDYFRKSF